MMRSSRVVLCIGSRLLGASSRRGATSWNNEIMLIKPSNILIFVLKIAQISSEINLGNKHVGIPGIAWGLRTVFGHGNWKPHRNYREQHFKVWEQSSPTAISKVNTVFLLANIEFSAKYWKKSNFPFALQWLLMRNAHYHRRVPPFM